MSEVHSNTAREMIRVGQMEIRYLQEAGNGCQMGCFEMRVPPGSNVPPPHSHTANEELVYVLDGTLRYTVGSETRDLQAGDSMATPPGVVHSFSNPHALMARALVINTPDIGSSYFSEVASIINGSSPPDRARLVATMQRFGLVLAAPPVLSSADDR
ncbi:MAG: cupin domain-containing protein [Polaromonas sp.]